MFKEIEHDVVYTDADFKHYGDTLGYLLAQVPYHPSGRFLLPFLAGKIPEWRGRYSSSWFNKHLSSKLSSVYAFVYSTECINYAHWIAKKCKVPLIVHLADHSPEFERSSSRETLRGASKLVCITEEMKSLYERTLGRKDIEVLHNGAEQACSDIAAPLPEPFSAQNPFVLCFIGSLFSNLHGDCIEDFFEAVSEIRVKYPWIEFHLYGQRQPADFLEDLIHSNGFTHHGVVPVNKKFDVMEKAHCFVIPSSFKAEKHLNYRYSFPTKLPELIASGRPILSYGPQETATNRILMSNNLGLRIHDRSVPKLVESLDTLASRYQESVTKFASVSPSILEKFSAESVRRKLRNLLSFN
ncbi:MAG: glycosyltransferase [Verrucomicrobia bacterium]|nr:glycosyltransferase [Verrucomicrobiota bacterium]